MSNAEIVFNFERVSRMLSIFFILPRPTKTLVELLLLTMNMWTQKSKIQKPYVITQI